MSLCNMVHDLHKTRLLKVLLMLDSNSTRTKMNFYISRNEYRRFKDTCKNQEETMSMLLKNIIKKSDHTAELDLT